MGDEMLDSALTGWTRDMEPAAIASEVAEGSAALLQAAEREREATAALWRQVAQNGDAIANLLLRVLRHG